MTHATEKLAHQKSFTIQTTISHLLPIILTYQHTKNSKKNKEVSRLLEHFLKSFSKKISSNYISELKSAPLEEGTETKEK
jgi:hypothetical protein